MEPTCANCHVTVRITDFFCFNCGRNLHDFKTVSVGTQMVYYIGSILMPPMGIFWGIKFLRQPDETSRRAGYVCIALTVVSLLYFTYQTMKVYSAVSRQIAPQMNIINELR